MVKGDKSRTAYAMNVCPQRGRTCIRAGMTLTCTVILTLTAGCADNTKKLAEQTQSQVDRWADELDKQTTETGVYIRPQKEELPEKDSWGTPLKFSYSQGGVAEILTVRSAGSDRQFGTQDDVTAQRTAVNLKGVGEGIKKNVEEVAEKGARGATRGVIEGLKEARKKGNDERPKQDVQEQADP